MSTNQGWVGTKSVEQDELSALWSWIARHFRARPFRAHFGAWMVIAAVLGLLMCPNFSLPSLIGFGISALVCCGLLSLVTWPLSDDYRITMAGALCGLVVISPLLAGMPGGLIDENNTREIGLIAGSLAGATSLLWLLPLRWLFRTVQNRQLARQATS